MESRQLVRRESTVSEYDGADFPISEIAATTTSFGEEEVRKICTEVNLYEMTSVGPVKIIIFIFTDEE
jgi:hypothetical protein